MLSRFNENAQKILLMMKKEMQELKHPYVSSEHLLLAILHCDDLNITKFLNDCGLNYELYKKEIVSVLGIGKNSSEWFLYTPLLKRIIENTIVNNDGDTLISVDDLFVSLLEEGDGVANRILMGMNIDIEMLYDKFSSKFNIKYNRSSEKLLVEEFAVDLNKKYNSMGFDPVYGRDSQVNRLLEILLRRTKNNPLLIGEAGVGKTAIVEELVRRIEEGNVPNKLLNKRILSLSVASLVAGTKYRGEFEERINQLIKELEGNEDIILFIDEFHTLVGAGGAEGAIDAVNIFKPYLARGSIRIIGATTKDEYDMFVADDKALDRRFQKVYVSEMSVEDTEKILFNLRELYQNFHNVIIPDEIIKEIIYLSEKYISNGKFPDKAIDVFDEVCARTNICINKFDKFMCDCNLNIKRIIDDKNKAIINHDYDKARSLKEEQINVEKNYDKFLLKKVSNEKRVVKMEYLYDVIYDRTKIPISYLKNRNINKCISNMKKYVFGQEKAINKIFSNIENASFVTKNRPIVLLLVGKSGVGKTFFVRKYAEMLYNKDSFIKLDMSEYKEEFSSSKIIGAPPGYVGYKNNKTILDKVKNNPYSVILLDEVEKACNGVLKLFLQVFDEGTMTSASGEIIDFSHTIIFLTSNLGVSKNSIGFFNTDDKVISDEVKNYLGIELFNRIDDVVVFDSLSEKTIKKIINKKLLNYDKDNSLKLKVSTEIVNKVLKEVDIFESGARKIDKIVEKIIKESEILNI